jgi:hypothetical protein
MSTKLGLLAGGIAVIAAAIVVVTVALWPRGEAQAQVPGGAVLAMPVVQCTGPSASVTFNWTPTTLPADSQFLDLSTLNNNFAPFSFISNGPFAPTHSTLTWPGLTPGYQHFWRIGSGVPGVGWVFSRTGSFAPCGPNATGNPSTTNYGCMPQGTASVVWTLSNLPFNANLTFIDISLQNNGFVPGTFVGTNASGTPTFTWGGILRNATHFWRVNNLTPQGWITSASGTFTAFC